MASSSSTGTTDHRGGSANTDVHPDIIQTHILTRLDGPTLATFSCVSSQLRSICTEESLWKALCNSNWPSTKDARVREIISTFPSGYRSFFSDAYPTSWHRCYRTTSTSAHQEPLQTSELISAVDIHYGSELIYSKVAVTETGSFWLKSSPLRVDLLETTEIVQKPSKFDFQERTCMEKNMRLSWILIDPVKKRAVNLSSLRPVEVQQHQSTGKILILYATVIAAGADVGFVKCGVDVTCVCKVGGFLHLREIGMQLEDMEGNILNKKDSLEILQAAMDGKRVKSQIGEEQKMFEIFMLWRKFYISAQFVGKQLHRETRA